MICNSLEELLEYKFKEKALLIEAISHPSMRGTSDFKGRDYERLEFLGDAVVNLIVTNVLFAQFPKYPEGELAKIRAYLISKEYMVQKAQELEIGKYIIMAFGEEASGGRSNPNNLENVLEAIIGAIFLDGGFAAAEKVVQNIWGKVDPEVGVQANPKSTLQEMMQDLNMKLPHYEVIKKEGEMHAPTYTVSVKANDGLIEYGVGNNIKSAEKNAAKNMIKKLKNQSHE